MNRSELITRTINALQKKGFSVSTFFNTNTCFDFIANKEGTTLIVKVYENIDSIRKGQGNELRKLGLVLNANCIIIGEKTKVFSLKNRVVYSRYDVPVVSISTFEGMLENKAPRVKYFKGKEIVDIDFEKLRKKREDLQLSIGELAGKLGLASETLHRFEKGASTSLETAGKLEKFLDKELIMDVDVFGNSHLKEFDEVPREKLLEKIHDLGLKMALFSHSPFDAYGKSNEGLFISTGKGKFDIPKKALELKKVSTSIKSDSVIVTKEYKYKSIDHIPIIEEEDLETIDKVKDLKKLIREREKD